MIYEQIIAVFTKIEMIYEWNFIHLFVYLNGIQNN